MALSLGRNRQNNRDEEPQTNQAVAAAPFDQPVILKRSPVASRLVVWGIVGFTSATLLWASFAKIDEAVPATGNLAPQGAVRAVQVPINGKVKEVFVKDGQQVKQGDLLLTLDQEAAAAQLASLKTIRQAIAAENKLYSDVMNGIAATPSANLQTSTQLLDLTKSRSALQAELDLFRAQLTGSTSDLALSTEQQLRLQMSQAERDSRRQSAQLDTEQLQQQLAQAQSKLANAQDNLRINQGIYKDLEPVAQQGGLSKVQFLRQQQEVTNGQLQVDQTVQEIARLQLAIAQSRQRLDNTVAVSNQDILTRMAENEKKIAEIDSQFNKAIVENNKKIAEIDSQISQTKLTLQYQELRSPADGIVFDLKAANPGFVATSTEPVLKVVPDQALTVEVYITNKDIGFVKPGMPVDIRVDSFPFSEFGDIKGELVSIGSDALPPTELRPYYSFPAKVKLNQQTLNVRGREVRLQSGMSVSVNIKVRDRTIMSIFTDGFRQQAEELKTVR